MPYIKKDLAEEVMFEWGLAKLLDNIRMNNASSGTLNYIITSILVNYFEYNNLNYANLSIIRAVLHDASDEFYRRLVALYEDQKAKTGIDPYEIIIHDKVKKG